MYVVHVIKSILINLFLFMAAKNMLFTLKFVIMLTIKIFLISDPQINYNVSELGV